MSCSTKVSSSSDSIDDSLLKPFGTLGNMHLSRFEKVPQEIRDQIYRHIFPCDEILVPGVHHTCGPIDKPFPSLAMLQVNRRIATEAAMVLFEQNVLQIRMPPIHGCCLGHCTNKNGCTDVRSGEPVKEDNHSCTYLGCLPGPKQRHLAQRLLQRYSHQVQHVHLALNSSDLLRHHYYLGKPWMSVLGATLRAREIYDDHKSCDRLHRIHPCEALSYVGWTWEGNALSTIASTWLKSMTLDLGPLWWDGYIIGCEESQRARKSEFVRLMQALFRGLEVRHVTFQQIGMERDVVSVWLNPGFDKEAGSGWIESLTVIGLPWKDDTAVFLAGLKQEGHRAATSSSAAASFSENLALSNMIEHDELNTWLK